MADAKELSPEKQYELILSNLQEVLNPEIIKDIVNNEDPSKNRPLKVYWGTATTGRPHCGYFVPVMKLAELLAAGCEITILLADVHAMLDADKCPPELVDHRVDYYQRCIQAALSKSLKVDISKLKFVKGSSYQNSPEYGMDLWRILSIVSVHDAGKAGSEVVKQEKDAKMSGLVYPLMQVLDEVHLGVDAQFGGVDQRKIFTLAKDVLPKMGHKQCAHLMNPMVPGLQGGKMSASDANSKIDLLEDAASVKKKITKAEAVPKVEEGNGLLSYIERVLLPASNLTSGTSSFKVERRDQEPLEYTGISKIREDYKNDVLTPQLLKSGVVEALNNLLAPIQKEFQESTEWQELVDKAYPPPVEVKKVKKVKNKGTGRPGGARPEQEVTEGIEKLEVAA